MSPVQLRLDLDDSNDITEKIKDANALFVATDKTECLIGESPSGLHIEVCKTALHESEVRGLVTLLESYIVYKKGKSQMISPATIQIKNCSDLETNGDLGNSLVRALGTCSHVGLLQSYAFTCDSMMRPFLAAASSNLKLLRIEEEILRQETMHVLASAFESLGNPNLQIHSLHLNRSKLSRNSDFQLLSSAIKNYPHLKRLELNAMGLKDCHLQALLVDETDAKKCSLPALESLGISFNRFQDVSCLANFLKHPECKLQALTLGYASTLNQKIDITSIAEALQTNKTLRTLKLPRNRLKDSDAALMAQCLLENYTLETLDLRKNYISDEGIICLAKVARGEQKSFCSKGLRALQIAKNPFGMSGSVALLEAASQNYNLVHIDVCVKDNSTSRRKKPRSSLDNERVLVHRKILYHTTLNRGGRRLLMSENSPLALLPFAMERCEVGLYKRRTTKLRLEDHFNCMYILDEETVENEDYTDGSVDLRRDVLYLLLKENATSFSASHE